MELSKVELVTFTEHSRYDKKLIKTKTIEVYEANKSLRTVTKIEISGRNAHISIANVFLDDGEYQHGTWKEIDLKEAKKFWKKWEKVCEKSGKSEGKKFGNGFIFETFYF